MDYGHEEVKLKTNRDPRQFSILSKVKFVVNHEHINMSTRCSVNKKCIASGVHRRW